MKKTLLISIFITTVVVVGFGLFFQSYLFPDKHFIDYFPVEEPKDVTDLNDISTTSKEVNIPSGTKIADFSGLLEEVNIGCFADGECYVKVDGKHVTVLVGRRQEVVGTIVGVDSFGSLEDFVGDKVEIFAEDLGDGNYTLYGSEAFYLKVLGAGGGGARMGETIEILGNKITPLEILEDSRCPTDVQCIQAGTVRLRVDLENSLGKSEQIFTLREAVTTENYSISLVRVEPMTDSRTAIGSSEYSFYFKVQSK